MMLFTLFRLDKLINFEVSLTLFLYNVPLADKTKESLPHQTICSTGESSIKCEYTCSIKNKNKNINNLFYVHQ